jgi:RNA polymerase sigma-70 factor (ECF subfamily)
MKNTGPSEELEKVINRARSGDPAAVSYLYESFVDRIYRYIAFRVPDEDAEDIASDVFVRMVESLPQYTYTGAPFEAWLYKIAAARVADFHRARSKRQHEEINELMSDSQPLPEEHLEDQQELQLLRAALQNLTEEEQTILILRFVERKGHNEVAEIMGKSASAVRTMQHRALSRLSQVLEGTGKSRHYLRGILRPPEDE